MSKKLIYLFSFVLLLSLVGRVSAQEADVLIRSPDAAMPIIDGVVDDVWSASTEQSITITVSGSDPSGPADCSGTWKALWDWEYLYALVVVKDEALNNDSGAGSKWNDDSVEFYVDGDNSKGATCDENDHQYTCRWNNTEVEEPSAFHNGEPSLVGIEYAVVTTGNGYIFEVRIPWTSIMGTGPTPSQEIGIEVFINDDDDGSDRDSQIAWFGTDGNGWQTPSMWATGLLVAGNIAGAPKPANGVMHTDIWANLSWVPGPTAVSHDVYLGDNFDDVNDGTGDTFQGNQTITSLLIGFPGFSFPDGLVPGVTYYWRIDEIAADGTIYKGPVWSFMVPPKTAYWPDPVDGAEQVDPDVELSWTAGFNAKLHTVYFGENFDDVNNATEGLPQGITTYTPGPLKLAKTYYWRVDEFDAFDTYKGDVWSFTTEGGVGSPNPSNGAVDVEQTPVLTWTPGVYAASHQVYFGTDKDVVRNADTSSPEYKATGNLGSESYNPGKLQWYSTYYWRIDEANNVNPDSPWTGNVWSFTTADFIVIDDFEDYNDYPPDEIFSTWIDGWEVPTNGSMAGHADPPFAETGNVHGGSQSMPLYYDNNFMYSEATMTLTQRNWTEEDVGVLSLWFRGNADNAAERMYVALNGSAVVYHDNPDAAQIATWTQWRIDLQEFAAQGVNLANVNTISIGFGDKNNLQAGGSGMVLFDDIRLYRPAPPEVPEGLVALWNFDEGSGTTAADSSGNGLDGAISGAMWVSPGADGTGSCLDFDGQGSNRVSLGNFDVTGDGITIACWYKADNLDTPGNDPRLFSKAIGGNNQDHWFMISSSRVGSDKVLRFRLKTDGDTGELKADTATGLIDLDVWTHVAAVWDGATMKLYKNGVEVGSIDKGGTLSTNPDANVAIGNQPVGTDGRPWDGLIDDVQLYNRGLSEAEIAELAGL